MINQNQYMQDTWKKFIFPLIEAKKRNMEEESYHSLIENQLQLLGWATYMGEISHKENIPIGNNNHIQPDILVKKNNDVQFVIEVKRPVHDLTERERIQLESYMRQLKVEVGLYIGDHIEVIYDKPKSKNAISVLKVFLDLEDKHGDEFVDLFSKDNFSKDSVIKYCEDRLIQMRRQADLSKIRDEIVADAENRIAMSLTITLTDKYGDSFTKEEIKEMLSSITFTAVKREQKNASAQSPKEKASQEKHSLDYTTYSVNGSEFVRKNQFVLKVVTTYVKQHPEATFAELEGIFKPELQGSFGVIRTLDFIRQKKFISKRYFTKDTEVLQSADNVPFAVSSEWGKVNIANIENLAKGFGYEVRKKNSDSKSEEALSKKMPAKNTHIKCYLTRHCDAQGLFDIHTQSLTVLKGSKINPAHLRSFSERGIRKRAKLIDDYAYLLNGDLTVRDDVKFSSPSGASVFCIGGESNGYDEWKDENGNRLQIYREVVIEPKQ